MTNGNPPEGESMDRGLRQRLDERLAAPHQDDDALLARVQARVMAAVRQDALPANRTVRADEGWQNVCPGIEVKLLWENGGARSILMRVAPGASVPAHVHAMDEECVVLEGTVLIGDDIVLHPGDFHVGRGGTSHAISRTQTGALVYLRGALELL